MRSCSISNGMENRSYGMLVVAGMVALGAVGTALVTVHTQNEGAEPAKVAAVSTSPAEGASDSDSDGLLDWQEALWGTDPNNPDSDGDGVSDGDEITTGVNPLKEGGELLSDMAYVAPKGLAPTEALARELFVGYADIRKDGTIGEAERDTVIADMVLRRSKEITSVGVFEISDLTVADDTPAAVYEGALISILKKSTAVREYELMVFARVVNSGTASELKKIEAAAVIYQDILDSLLAVSVPTPLAVDHLKLVNSIASLAAATEALALWSGDPLDALAVVNAFSEAEDIVGEHIDTTLTFTRALKQSL